MRRRLVLLFVLAALVAAVMAAVPAAAAPPVRCTTIQSGLLNYSLGHYLNNGTPPEQPISVGYDMFGYNYQAHMFSGSYFNAYAGGAGLPPYVGDDAAYLAANPGAASHWAWPYRADQVTMKWNDAWLSNKDCGIDGVGGLRDGKLDRHFGYVSYIGSGAWETNHQWGEYGNFNWNYFVKIVAVPRNAVLKGYVPDVYEGDWYTSGDVLIGPSIWGDFAIIQEVYNDTGTGDHGLVYKSPFSAGFGAYGPNA